MTFTLHVDGTRWRANATAVRDAVRASLATGAPPYVEGDLVPVTKGNGYGLGNVRLAREAQRLGLTRIAVGTVYEVADVAAAHDGDILVLTPYDPRDVVAEAVWSQVERTTLAGRVLRTIASRHAWDELAGRDETTRVVLEALTSMGRFGLEADELTDLLAADSTLRVLASGRLVVEGLALHLPLTQPAGDHRARPAASWHDATVAPAPPAHATARVSESASWGLGWQSQLGDLSERLAATGSAQAVTSLTSAASLWVSHLDDSELAALRGALPDIALYARVGTRLWLGDRGSLVPRGTVLATHLIGKGEASGYRQRRAARASAIVVVGGGTAHGVALEAPSPASSVRQRAVAAGTGVLEAGGRSLSPFWLGGKQRWFAEPPHMQVSLIRVPEGTLLPEVGDEIDVDVRLTTAHFDRVLGLD